MARDQLFLLYLLIFKDCDMDYISLNNGIKMREMRDGRHQRRIQDD